MTAALPPDAALAASVALLSRARILAHALVGVRSYGCADRLTQQGTIYHELRELVRGLDEPGVASVATTCRGILGPRDETVRKLWRESQQTESEVFRGLGEP